TRARTSFFRSRRMSFVCLWIQAPSIGEASSSAPGQSGVARAEAAARAPSAGAEGGSLADFLAGLLSVAPHIAMQDRSTYRLVWLDGRGLHARRVADDALEVARAHGVMPARAGAARTPIAAEAAATRVALGNVASSVSSTVVVGAGDDRSFLAPLPISTLVPALAPI